MAIEPAPAPPSQRGCTGGREGSAPDAPRPRTPRAPPVQGSGSAKATFAYSPPLLPGSPSFSPPSTAGRAPKSGTSESRGSAVRPGRNTPRLRAAAPGAVTAAPGSLRHQPREQHDETDEPSPAPHAAASPFLLLPAIAPQPLRDIPHGPAPALLSVGRRACRSRRRASPLAGAAAGRTRAAVWPRPLPPRLSRRDARGLRQGARGCAELAGAPLARARERGRGCARSARGGGSGARRPRRVSGAGGRWARAAAPAPGVSLILTRRSPHPPR